MKETNKEKAIEIINTLQGMANDFKPDDGMLDEEEEKELNLLLHADYTQNSTAKEMKDTMGSLVHFCGDWFPDGDYDEEELEEYQETMNEAEELTKNDSFWELSTTS